MRIAVFELVRYGFKESFQYLKKIVSPTIRRATKLDSKVSQELLSLRSPAKKPEELPPPTSPAKIPEARPRFRIWSRMENLTPMMLVNHTKEGKARYPFNQINHFNTLHLGSDQWETEDPDLEDLIEDFKKIAHGDREIDLSFDNPIFYKKYLSFCEIINHADLNQKKDLLNHLMGSLNDAQGIGFFHSRMIQRLVQEGIASNHQALHAYRFGAIDFNQLCELGYAKNLLESSSNPQDIKIIYNNLFCAGAIDFKPENLELFTNLVKDKFKNFDIGKSFREGLVLGLILHKKNAFDWIMLPENSRYWEALEFDPTTPCGPLAIDTITALSLIGSRNFLEIWLGHNQDVRIPPKALTVAFNLSDLETIHGILEHAQKTLSPEEFNKFIEEAVPNPNNLMSKKEAIRFMKSYGINPDKDYVVEHVADKSPANEFYLFDNFRSGLTANTENYETFLKAANSLMSTIDRLINIMTEKKGMDKKEIEFVKEIKGKIILTKFGQGPMGTPSMIDRCLKDQHDAQELVLKYRDVAREAINEKHNQEGGWLVVPGNVRKTRKDSESSRQQTIADWGSDNPFAPLAQASLSSSHKRLFSSSATELSDHKPNSAPIRSKASNRISPQESTGSVRDL